MKIDLLTIEEYNKYKSKIPYIKCDWWLRSPGNGGSNCAAYVYADGPICDYGEGVHYTDYGVRPAIYVAQGVLQDMLGQRIMYASFPWIVIDSSLAIAEVLIGFTYFDEVSNNYETSHIKQFIEQWIGERSSNYGT